VLPLADILHYRLYCFGCGKPILLPLEMLDRAFSLPEHRTKDAEFVAAVCAHCKQVQNYDLQRKSLNPPSGPMVSLPQLSDWEFLGWLRCEETDCKPQLPLFAPVDRTLSASNQTKEVQAWTGAGDLVCPAGHKIQLRR
jgi:hypothetical protein